MQGLHVGMDLRIADSPGSERTGLGRYALEIAGGLSAVRPGWHLSIYSNRPELLPPDLSPACRSTVWPTGSSIGRVAWLHAGSILEVARHRPDIWFGPTFVTPLWWRQPAVVMVQDLVFMLMKDRYRGRINSLHATLATRSSVRRATRVLCPSAETRQVLRDRLGVPDDKLRVVPNGVSEVFFERNGRGDERAAAQLPYVLFVGTFEARKGLDTLRLAMNQVNRDRPRVRLVLAGRPGWGTDLIVKGLLQDGHTEVVPSPSDRELARLYRGAVALVYPSRMEGFGLPVAEAMASGTPVVTTALECIREFAGDAALYVDPDDPVGVAGRIGQLLDEPSVAAAASAKGRRAAESLRWEGAAEHTARAIEEAAAAA